jgi:hypothetical protein
MRENYIEGQLWIELSGCYEKFCRGCEYSRECYKDGVDFKIYEDGLDAWEDYQDEIYYGAPCTRPIVFTITD